MSQALQISNHFSLAEAGLSPDDVEEILKSKSTEQPGSDDRQDVRSTDKPESTAVSHTPDILKSWMESAKNNDVTNMEALLNAHKSLLNAKQPGIGNSALHWAAFKDNTQVTSIYFHVWRQYHGRQLELN
jgi:hypothetical protein